MKFIIRQRYICSYLVSWYICMVLFTYLSGEYLNMTDTIGDVDVEFDECALSALARVTSSNEANRARALKESRAWSVDEETEDGATLIGLVRELMAKPIVNPRKPPKVELPSALTISICPRVYEQDPTVFEVPEGATLIKAGKESYQVVVDTTKSICFTFTRYGRLKLGRHAGFKKDRQHATFKPSINVTMRVVTSAS
jgi:hypothetical protein